MEELSWKGWDEVPAHQKLVGLARTPYDLTNAQPEQFGDRLSKYRCFGAGYELFYGTQRIDDAVLDGLQELADQCQVTSQFDAMKGGRVMNTIAGVDSESRQVLHTSCRDHLSATPAEPAATRQTRRELEKLERFLHEIDSGHLQSETGKRFTTMIHVGIGGSDLGPRSIYEALRPFGIPERKVYFISNVDPDDATAILGKVDLSRTLVNVVSKSGSTLETLTNETFVRNAYVEAGLDPARHFIAVTGENSPMDNPQRYLRSFYMFDYIGGRFSATSMVGLVMLGFYMGYEQVMEFLRGAAAMDKHAEDPDIRKNIPLLMALIGVWNHNYLNMATLAILPYSQALHRFPAHLQQCDMESNGKAIRRDGRQVEGMTGPVIWGEPGTNGQHAFYQLLHQGTEVVPVEFIGFRKSQYNHDHRIEGTGSQQKLVANLLAQSLALACGQQSSNRNKFFPGNRPNAILLGERLTPESMGALLALYEAKIVFQGFLWNINSFDQEGVQLGKVLATRILQCMHASDEENESIERQLLKVCGIGDNNA